MVTFSAMSCRCFATGIVIPNRYARRSQQLQQGYPEKEKRYASEADMQRAIRMHER